MKHYKVWVSIEEIDEEADHYEDMGLPDPLATFYTYDGAADFVRSLPGWAIFGDGANLTTSDHRADATPPNPRREREARPR